MDLRIDSSRAQYLSSALQIAHRHSNQIISSTRELSSSNTLTLYRSGSLSLSFSLSRFLLSKLSRRGRATSLQTCLMWNAHERRSEKYSQSTRMLTNFKTVCGVPGANIHSLATCFHVIVGRPPNYSKIIHRHTYNPL